MRLFWSTLKDAFEGADGFTVILHTKSGKTFNVAMSSPGFSPMGQPTSAFIEGENIHADRQPIVIPFSAIEAYEIEN